MSNEKAYIVYLNGFENAVDININGKVITHKVQSEMLTVALWAESLEEAKLLAKEIAVRGEDPTRP